MCETEQILRKHAARYAQMQPTDAVKLIFQNEFGGGHMIRDEKKCLAYLQKEFEATAFDPQMPPCEDIGNGIVRVNLAAVRPEELALLGEEFLRSAEAYRGTLRAFLEKLEVLKAVCAQGVFAFSAEALAHYLADYEQAGYPAVSHSPQYRAAYRPAYRVLLAANAAPWRRK